MRACDSKADPESGTMSARIEQTDEPSPSSPAIPPGARLKEEEVRQGRQIYTNHFTSIINLHPFFSNSNGQN